ncbi:uncharacterized protein KZ484_016320 [Pholidichthys leucotaenia]
MMESYIIAIDFGTAYSGHAFSITASGTEIDPQVKRWGKEHGLDTPKTPTCILFNEREEFLKFGYEARMAYINMKGAEGQKNLYFENFKMALYDKELNKDVTIKAANGKSVKALKVFTEALRYLKEDALKTIASNTSGKEFKSSDFTWVLTVPAIWDPSAKQFMREAATQAGIVTKGTKDNLVIALEPEAASVLCKRLPADGFITLKHDGVTLDQQPGTQYIVVDCGGGTIDITAHEVLDGGSLKELLKASGNDLGGQTVDRKFKEFLREIFCDGVWEEYETKYPSEAQKMMYNFTFYKQVDDDIQISCPFNLGSLAQCRQEIERFFIKVKGASWDEGEIRISKDRLRSFFEDSLKGISDLLQEILKNDLKIELILLVGGFAESKILRQNVLDIFGHRCEVLCPFRPQEAILRGALMYGSNPELVAYRKSAFTYGVAVSVEFDKTKHRVDKKYKADGEWLCHDVFMKLVEEDEDVGWDKIREHILIPVEADQTTIDLIFYRTERKYPTYIDDPGVKKIASLEVPMPDTTKGKDREMKLEIRFGSTEITATGTDLETGTKRFVKIDFMIKLNMGDSFVIAIDFGTAYSGYAFSMTKSKEEIEPTLKFWGEEVGLMTPKTPTSILFDEHGKFMDFGYKAKVAYHKMGGKDAQKMFFFDCFKMELYGKELNKDVTIKAANGKSMKALKVFTEALTYLKNDALKTIKQNTAGKKFIPSDFTWVLTVPAIWDPSAKQFMREAATQAGIVTQRTEDKLVIALEPEAASLWCKKLPTDGFITPNHDRKALDQQPGTQYIVVDCGGGTIDITVHEVLSGASLKELHKASGNNLGGQTVDRKFKEFLREIFSGGVWEEFETKYPSEVEKMMYEFTFLKQVDEDIQVSCPINLGTLAQNVKNIPAFFDAVSGASWNDGFIKISRQQLKSFFAQSLQGITELIRKILRNGSNIEYILLVGGYATSQILHQHILDQFSAMCEVLCPSRPQEAILKGAVQFGRNPKVVLMRKSAFTYGFNMSERFDMSKHRPDKKYTNNDGVWCADIFKKMVEINEDVGCDEMRDSTLYPIRSDQTSMTVNFYRTENKSPKYVDEEGTKNIGTMVVDMHDTRGGMERKVRIKMKFGFTEITAMGTDMNSGSTVTVELNFMTQTQNSDIQQSNCVA